MDRGTARRINRAHWDALAAAHGQDAYYDIDALVEAYGTAPGGADGRQIPVLRSADLVEWEALGHALEPTGAAHYWAPEVAFHEGRFYMYYSSGSADEGTDQKLRVAVSDDPAGPFVDTGKILVPDQAFSIDAHPYRHSDGQWYLFYCVDFLHVADDHRVGTGIVVEVSAETSKVVVDRAGFEVVMGDYVAVRR